MITVNKEKCLRCGKCTGDCIIKILRKDEQGYPFLAEKYEKSCLDCQHCLAICPTGALTCNGVSADQCEPIKPLPDPEDMLALLRQRRSVRKYKWESLQPEILEKLKGSFAWAPTGCNDHRLIFRVIDTKEEMLFYREETNRMILKLVNTGIMKWIYPAINRFLESIKNGEDVIYRGAPHMIVAATPKNAPCAGADPWIALSYFDLLLQSYGLGSCWCGFAVHAFKWNRTLKKKLNFPKGYKIAAVLLFGKPDVEYCRATKPENFKIL